MLTLMFMSIIQYGSNPDYGVVALNFVIQLVVGAAMGFLLGRGAVTVINRIKLGNTALYPILLLTIGIFIYASTYYLQGNGYLAVYIAGLVIGNHKFTHKRTSMKFMDGFAWMSQILLFLTLDCYQPQRTGRRDCTRFLISVSSFDRPSAHRLPHLAFADRVKDNYISWVGLRERCPLFLQLFLRPEYLTRDGYLISFS